MDTIAPNSDMGENLERIKKLLEHGTAFDGALILEFIWALRQTRVTFWYEIALVAAEQRARKLMD